VKTFVIRALVALATALSPALCLATSAADAAEMRMEGQSISVKGRIEYNDDAKFRAELGRRQVEGVILQSDGGNIAAAINIREEIVARNMSTWVAGPCTSACGLIWLAGKKRFFLDGSSVGFHGAYLPDGRIDSGANALVGAYLSRLGFDYDTIRYLTSAPPQNMTWLNVRTAGREYGISVIMCEVVREAKCKWNF
jgi:hypothetical protein